LGPAAAARAAGVLTEFAGLMRDYGVDRYRAVATGIIREAMDRDRFLAHIREETGIQIEVISGEREALLSGRGAVTALGIRRSYLVFDLGGGTTEFLQERGGMPTPCSISLGAAVLTKRCIRSDPPDKQELDAISSEIDQRLKEAGIRKGEHMTVVGTGGTVTALAALIDRVPADDITPEQLNGRVLAFSQLETSLEQMKALKSEERVARLGLDRGRADVIVAGVLVVMGILRFMGVRELTVSMSDLLEGLLIEDRSRVNEDI